MDPFGGMFWGNQSSYQNIITFHPAILLQVYSISALACCHNIKIQCDVIYNNKDGAKNPRIIC